MIDNDNLDIGTGTITSGNVNGIDIATDVGANNTYRGVGHLPLAGGTLTGDLVCGDNDITGIRTAGFTGVGAAGSKTASFNVDFDTDQSISVTLTANTMTATLQTPLTSDSTHTLYITNGGLATLTWATESGSVYWTGGDAPTLTSSGLDIVVFKWNGVSWFGEASLDVS